MPQPIVPVEIPQSRPFDSKKRNDILLKIRIGKLEVSFFQSLNLEMIEQLLDKVLLYDNSSIQPRAGLSRMWENGYDVLTDIHIFCKDVV